MEEEGKEDVLLVAGQNLLEPYVVLLLQFLLNQSNIEFGLLLVVKNVCQNIGLNQIHVLFDHYIELIQHEYFLVQYQKVQQNRL